MCNISGVLRILLVDHRVESTCMADIELILDDANTITLHKAQLSIFSCVAHFERSSMLVEHIRGPI